MSTRNGVGAIVREIAPDPDPLLRAAYFAFGRCSDKIVIGLLMSMN